MSKITNQGAFDTINQIVNRHVQTVARSKSKRSSGPVLDAATGLLARMSMGQNTRKQTASGFCFLLNSGEFGFQQHSDWPKPAFAERRRFHTHTHNQPVINSHTTHISTVQWYSKTLHVAAATQRLSGLQTTDYGIGRFESPLGHLPGIQNVGTVPHLISPTYKRYHLQLLKAPSKPLQIHCSPSSHRLQYKTTQNQNCTHSESVSSSYFFYFILVSSSSVSNFCAHNWRAVKTLSFTISGKNVCCYTKSKRKVSHTLLTQTIEQAIVSLKNNPYFPFRRSIVPSLLEDKSTLSSFSFWVCG
jgi:hypothetical protein